MNRKQGNNCCHFLGVIKNHHTQMKGMDKHVTHENRKNIFNRITAQMKSSASGYCMTAGHQDLMKLMSFQKDN